MVEDGDAKGARGRPREALARPTERAVVDLARLIPPPSDRVDPDDVQAVRRVQGLRRLPLPLELAERAREAGGERVRDVVVARHRDDRQLEALQEARGTLVLVAPAAVREIAA